MSVVNNMLRQHQILRRLTCLPSFPVQYSAQNQSFLFASTAASTGNVPDGHLNSDLSSTVCNIGLGRRRDLTLRQDLCLWQGSEKKTLADVFRGKKVILVGFPGGPICTKEHIPGYISAVPVLKKMGVDKVVFVTVADPEQVAGVASTSELQHPQVEIYSDANGGFMQLLGTEMLAIEAPAPSVKCQRFAAIVDDGILCKLRVETRPVDLKVSDVNSMLKVWGDFFCLT